MMQEPIAITGANGFIGMNLVQRFREQGLELRCIPHTADQSHLLVLLRGVRIVFHLAGVNRPERDEEFISGNEDFTKLLCGSLRQLGQATPIVYASSVHAANDSAYGRSKRAAEAAVAEYAAATGALSYIFRLPSVFGKWCRPDYNSVVATFCYRIARGIDIVIHDSSVTLNLVYIDDVVQRFIALSRELPKPDAESCSIAPLYRVTVGELADQIKGFRGSRETLVPGSVGAGFARALYATYVSYLPPAEFSYHLVQHADSRGTFVEMMRTPAQGQFSYFTAHPGVTRGGHYHHTKTEKFLVVEGKARFGFRNLRTDEKYELLVSAEEALIVETIPGWVHDITNIGEGKLIALLWANEVFDKENPDTIAAKV